MQKKFLKSNDYLLETYFKQIKAFPLISFDEELALSVKIQNGDIEALHKLVNSNLRLVVKIAGMYSKYGVPVMDIIQEGNIGLIHAAKKYDYRKNVRFCTYANWWIRQFISRYISNKRRIVRLPLRKEEALRKIQNAYNVLCQSLMHQPTNTDIARELGIPVREVDSIINMACGTMSYEQNFYSEEFGDIIDIQEDYTYCPERNFFKEYSHNNTMNVINKLKDREKHVINYRYQLNGCEYQTLREIGDKFNISPETVRQIEARALKKIRSHAKELKECMYNEAM